jgi:hypothetical protein
MNWASGIDVEAARIIATQDVSDLVQIKETKERQRTKDIAEVDKIAMSVLGTSPTLEAMR